MSSLTNTAYSFQYGGLNAMAPLPVLSTRNPTTTDTSYRIGQEWVNTSSGNIYFLSSLSVSTSGIPSATWTLGPSPSSSTLATLTGDSGGAISPSASNINVLGTANQITTTGSGSTITWALASTLIAPGSLEVTSGFTVDAGAVTIASGTSAINISADAANTTVNLATGAGVKTLTLGSTNSTSATTLQFGTGNCSIAGATSGTITIGAAAQTGAISLGTSTATNTVNVGTGNGNKTLNMATGTGTNAIHIADGAGTNTITMGNAASVNTITIGSTNSTSTTTIQAGTGGLALSAGGAVTMAPVTGSAASANITLNGRVFQSTHTGLTTASGSSQTFVITNSAMTATNQAVQLTVDNLGSNDAEMTIQRVLLASGSITVTLKNNGAAALNGDVHINGWILN